MSPATKFEDHPAISLILVDTSSNSDGEVSRSAMMKLIYELMLIVGQNMSLIQQANAQLQADEAQIAKTESDSMQKTTTEMIQKYALLAKEQAHQQAMATFSNIMKWTMVALGVVVGALLVESGIGLTIMLAAVAVTAIPVSNGRTIFDMGTDSLASVLEKIPGLGSTWSKIIAQVLMIVILTVVSCGAEGIAAGASKAASRATTEVAEEVASSANGSSWELKDFLPVRTAATSQMFFQTFSASGVLQSLAAQIPGSKAHPWITMIVTMIAELTVMLATFKMTPTAAGNTIAERLVSSIVDPSKLQMGVGTVFAGAQLTSMGAQVAHSESEIEQSNLNKEMAPLQSKFLFEEGFFRILSQMTNMAQQVYKASMETNTTLFKTDFSSDLKACVFAQQQYQG